MLAALVPSADAWRLEIDAEAAVVTKAKGIAPGDVKAVGGGVEIAVDAVIESLEHAGGEQIGIHHRIDGAVFESAGG